MPPVNQFPPKDPNATLDYKFDWASLTNRTGVTNWLSEGETIVSHTITVPDGITVASSSVSDNGTTVTVWISGGTDGQDYGITCKIITQSRIDERTVILPVRHR